MRVVLSVERENHVRRHAHSERLSSEAATSTHQNVLRPPGIPSVNTVDGTGSITSSTAPSFRMASTTGTGIISYRVHVRDKVVGVKIGLATQMRHNRPHEGMRANSLACLANARAQPTQLQAPRHEVLTPLSALALESPLTSAIVSGPLQATSRFFSRFHAPPSSPRHSGEPLPPRDSITTMSCTLVPLARSDETRPSACLPASAPAAMVTTAVLAKS